MHAKSIQSCLTLRDPMDCSPPGSSVLGILQAGVLEWVAMPFSRGSSRPKNLTRGSYVSCIGRQFFTISATWKAPHRAQGQWEIDTVGRVTVLGDMRVCFVGTGWVDE